MDAQRIDDSVRSIEPEHDVLRPGHQVDVRAPEFPVLQRAPRKFARRLVGQRSGQCEPIRATRCQPGQPDGCRGN